jgi:hypothetical protein
MRATVLTLTVLLAALALVPAHAAEGPGMTAARELDLAAHHLAATTQRLAQEGKLNAEAAETAAGFAALVRDFRFDLESSFLSVIQAEGAWAQVGDGFVATRDILADTDSRPVQHELLRVNTLMNRLDRAFGGSGYWYGRHGWSG